MAEVVVRGKNIHNSLTTRIKQKMRQAPRDAAPNKNSSSSSRCGKKVEESLTSSNIPPTWFVDHEPSSPTVDPTPGTTTGTLDICSYTTGNGGAVKNSPTRPHLNRLCWPNRKYVCPFAVEMICFGTREQTQIWHPLYYEICTRKFLSCLSADDAERALRRANHPHFPKPGAPARYPWEERPRRGDFPSEQDGLTTTDRACRGCCFAPSVLRTLIPGSSIRAPRSVAPTKTPPTRQSWQWETFPRFPPRASTRTASPSSGIFGAPWLHRRRRCPTDCQTHSRLSDQARPLRELF